MNIFENLININYQNNSGITGITDEFFCVYLYELLKKQNKNILVVVNSLYEANKIYSSLNNYTDGVFLFPMDDFLTSEAIAISPDLLISRMETIKNINSSVPKIIITNLMGYLRFLPTPEFYRDSIINISVGMSIEPKKLYQKLVNIGYNSETLVTKTGDVGLRGFVIDVFPLGEDNPYRIEFFGDEIESIRLFDTDTQKSLKNIKDLMVYPFSEFLIDENKNIDDDYRKQKYLPKYNKVCSIGKYLEEPSVVYKDFSQLKTSFSHLQEEIETYRSDTDPSFSEKYMFDFSDIYFENNLYYMSINNISSDNKIKVFNYDVQKLDSFDENASLINDYIRKCLNENKTVIICLKEYQIKNIIKILNMKFVETTIDNIFLNKVNIVNFDMTEGFIYSDYVFLSQREIFKEKVSRKKYKTKFKYASKINDINKLNVGDYVVHNVHGIGIYNGIKKLTVNGLDKDYIEVFYQGKDKLYIPVEKIDNLSKFSGKEGTVPKINKLGGTEWQRTKSRVNKRVADMAEELIKLYSERESRKGFSFSKDTDLQRSFEKDFPYELTKDQSLAIKQIKMDMESSKPMDRLLCGDVGFGKTEVAFEAAFKAIMDSKQVLLLCPTTILSSQHFENAKERFKNFPVSIALLNRFTSTKETHRIISGLKDGTIDFVIGTHRLLSDDVVPCNLGLLIIDEEQRFGVKHKEKIKQYKTNIDVLTLTATPIPRTLQMSMVGIRSLSLIETPPVDRYPIQTYVLVEKIKRLVPEAKINFAHGQMNKSELEDRMISFINREYDILICTTIIETGIDIPNVNTLIILNADHFGLSQLYQIRGRVGRSNKFAYAYLMYAPFKSLTETAVKRLNVIKDFTELGSGFSIATRDLSIRGAGDILGSEQAGFIDTVGIDLYLKMLNVEVARRRGEIIEEEDDDTKPLINVATHIKDSYVANEDLKIEIHRKINTIVSRESFESVKAELEDRFGALDNDMLVYMYEEWFEKLAKKVPLVNVWQTKNSIELLFDKKIINLIKIDDLFIKAFEITPMFRFQSRGDNVVITLDTVKLDKHPVYYLVELLLVIIGNNS
ncbi:MAG: DEAD/DEAH box helicase [Clostridium sp.]|nr:DEAD/DEAH box helicase [Clostridium sp.]